MKNWNKYLLIIGFLLLVVFQLIQSNRTMLLSKVLKDIKKKELLTRKKIDSLNVEVLKIDERIKINDTLVHFYKLKAEQSRRSKNYYKKKYNEKINTYSTLNRSERTSATKKLLHQ